MATDSMEPALGARQGDDPQQAVQLPTWTLVASGVISIAVGAAALIWPKPSLLVVGVLFGVYLALWGAATLLSAVLADGAATGVRILGVLIGVLGLLAGLVLMVRPDESVQAIVWVLGFWWCVLGTMELIRGIADAEGRLWNLMWGVLGIAAGAVLLAWPEIGLGTMVLIVGISLILQGLLEIMLVVAARGARA